MYPQPLQHQPTWSNAQFAQVPKPPSLSTWASAPVIHTGQNIPAPAVSHPHPHPHPHHSFVPPAPPGVNPQQWQNGRWIYTAPPGGVSSAQPPGPYLPPNLVGWHIPAGWGITPQYYHPPQRQAERSYWDTKLTDNGLGLENMHIKQEVAHTAPGGKGKTPHTPWAWVPRELDDESPPPSTSSTQYSSALQSQQPSPVEPNGRQNSTTASAAPVGSTAYPGPGQPGLASQSHAYFSVPADQHQQQHQQPSANAGPGSRPTLPPATTYSAHIRQRSNPQQTATATHHQPPVAAGSQSTTSTLPPQSSASAQASQRSHGLAAPTPQRPGRTESYTSVKQLRTTFSPAIVRTPNHYRHDSQPVVPSPRVPPWEDANSNTHSTGVSTSANKHLNGALQGMVPSPRVPPWNAHARENGGDSPTPAPRHLRSSRTEPSRMYETSTRPTQSVQRSYSIPEPPRPTIPVSRQNSMPTVPTGPESHHDHLHGLSSIGNLPQFAEEPDSVLSLSPLVGTEPSESSESSTSATVRAESPQPLFIPPRYSRSPSPSARHRRSRAVSPSSSSSPSSSDSEDSEDSDSRGGGPHHHHRRRRNHHHSSRGYRSPTHQHSQHRTSGGHQNNNNNSHYGGGGGGGATYAGTPQGRSPASSNSTHTYRSSSSSNPLPTPPQERRDPGFSLPPPQQPKPPRGTYRRALRYGFWNRRGDYLTMDKYVVYAPHNRANPPELEGYPAPTEGYKDHYGHFVKYDPSRCELPESLPRQGLPPVLPYEKFVTYVYM